MTLRNPKNGAPKMMLGFIVRRCAADILARQVRRSGATVNEYGVENGTPKVTASRLVDI